MKLIAGFPALAGQIRRREFWNERSACNPAVKPQGYLPCGLAPLTAQVDLYLGCGFVYWILMSFSIASIS